VKALHCEYAKTAAEVCYSEFITLRKNVNITEILIIGNYISGRVRTAPRTANN
jgi:hypothetical protein